MAGRPSSRSPLVVDVHDLGRRPGAMSELDRTVPAPERLGLDVIAVPEGDDLELHLRLESVQEGVLVSATARAHLVGECVRCLERVEDDLDVRFQELYVYDDRELVGDDAEDLPRLEGDLLDLEPALRDAVVLALPMSPLCRDDCPGLCPQCGALLADDPDHGHEELDPRWAALLDLTTDETKEG